MIKLSLTAKLTDGVDTKIVKVECDDEVKIKYGEPVKMFHEQVQRVLHQLAKTTTVVR